jgi:hypothetical protein
MHKLTFFPLGNADCFRVDLENGRQLLFDYAAMRDPKSENDLRIDLASALRADLVKRGKDRYEVVTFTHLDSDHTKGASEFFWLDHAKKYQGEGRIRITELWVPAAAIIEEGAEDEARIIRAEARHRLRQGYGIRIFSRPARLKEWLSSEGLSLESRRHLITDAGQVAPGFSLGADQVEFFVHSPFAIRQDPNTVVDRNSDAVVLHATFHAGGRETKVLLTADITYEVISDIVRVTKRMGNEARLVWDVVDVPHHSSYLALGPEKGNEVTEPVPEVAWLYEQGRAGGIIVSPSWRIPSEDTDQPPHRQAAKYYEGRARAIDGEFKVTMEYPKPSAPAPLVIKIDGMGSAVEKVIEGAAAVIVNRPAPRAG